MSFSLSKTLSYAVLAALLPLVGCERGNDSTKAASAAAGSEVAELQRALDDDAKKTAATNGAVAATNGAATNAAHAAKGSAATNAAVAKPATKDAQAKPPKLPRPFVVKDSFFKTWSKGGAQPYVSLEFSRPVDMTQLRDYVKIEPNVGALVVSKGSWDETYHLRGDFKPRTTYTLTVRKGLPMEGGTLTNDYRRTWTVHDRRPEISFASEGRYLPAGGRRAVAVKTVNVTNFLCQIRSVPVRNAVQLLAREEGCYDGYYSRSGDGRNTAELADTPITKTLRVKTRLNEEVTTLLDVRDDDGQARNGIYLLSAYASEKVSEWYRAWKLVCVTDIGLSVREANGTVYVWATSLTGGAPIAGLRVLVYGANNVVMGEGLTDAEGWCSCDMPEAGEPFAVVASTMDESDVTFLALRHALDEDGALGTRRDFVKANGSEAFVWTERGIYRHGEKILVHAILRNGKGDAPKPFPVTVELRNPENKVVQTRTLVTDRFGALACDAFSVADDQPSGAWTIRVATPGKEGVTLGERVVSIEEFVPPQIRVKVTPPAEGARATTNMVVSVAGEHLFGGPAKGLRAECSVLFRDEPFAPKGWEMFRFGDENRELKPNFERYETVLTGDDGVARFAVDFPAELRPRAAVKMVVQGSVFEAGGRAANMRAATILHAAPYYIGVALPKQVACAATPKTCRVVLLNPDGTPHTGARRLVAAFERVECVYGMRRTDAGNWEWRSDKVRQPLGDAVEVAVSETGLATLALPADVGGDVAVTLRDLETGVSFGGTYWVGGDDDAALHTMLENPSRVTLELDKDVYFPGERPRLTVKAPFAGAAWLTLLRDDVLYSQVVTLTNATSELVLEPVQGAWAPGADVALSVVQAARPGVRGLMNRAYGLVPLSVRTRDSALNVQVRAAVACAPEGGSTVTVDVDARGDGVVGETAVVTVVDEGINILTDEKTPDPVAWFGASRTAVHPLWDLYNRLLPLFEGDLVRAGVKTGGGAEGDLFMRMSPMPSRRFKPLSLWKLNVPLADGKATVPFTLPEFAGEVRVTAVAYGPRAVGAGAVQAKVAPNVVMQPDAPRFAAPGDLFYATVMLANRSGRAGTIAYDLMAGGAVALARPVHGTLQLADGASETLTIPVRAAAAPGEGTLVFVSEGLGEKHRSEILLPVRPAAPWVKTARTVRLNAGERRTFPNAAAVLPEAAKRTFLASASPVAELASALEYLTAYPYGCLEQTVSRVFPLVTAGGLLNTLPVRETSAAADAKGAVAEGIRRTCAMVRAHDFSMWPDTDYAPWDRAVSLWAAHFLVEAKANGFAVPAAPYTRVKGFLRTWAMSANTNTSVYACHTLALAGAPDRDRMLHWFDQKAHLGVRARAQLARAFVRTGDWSRATELLAHAQADDLTDTAFLVLALLDLDPKDARVLDGVVRLLQARDGVTRHWGTTAANAHALLALGAYYRHEPAPKGKPDLRLTVDGHEDLLLPKRAKKITGCGDVVVENRGTAPAFVFTSALALGDPAALGVATNGIAITRRYRRPDGKPADLAHLVRGDLLVVELALTAPAMTTYSDLVIEDLLPACFEPDPTDVEDTFGLASPDERARYQWEMRRELRDDRVLGFTKRFALGAGYSVTFRYAVRVVSAGEFVLPGPSVEAMYTPALCARGAASRLVVAP